MSIFELSVVSQTKKNNNLLISQQMTQIGRVSDIIH